MLITEAEARKKWCPYARVEGNNRLHNIKTGGVAPEDASNLCVGSQCMAWREFHLKFAHGGDLGGEPHGYCGLAGQPTHE